MDIIEIIGALIGLAYLVLEYKANVWLWPVGIVMSLFYVVIYINGKFYADAGLQIYYICANIYGLALWTYKKHHKTEEIESKKENFAISKTPKKRIFPIAAVALALWAGFYFILKSFTDSPVPVGDAFTTSLSIVATWMLAQKYVEQWILWIVVDVISVTLYFWKGLYPTAILYVVYVVVATMGYFNWRKQMKQEQLEGL